MARTRRSNVKSNSVNPPTEVPTGTMVMFGGTVAPEGWLLCNNAAISRTDFAMLFDVIGTTYGTGNGSTTFNVPSFAGRRPMGAGAFSETHLTTTYTPGQIGGSALLPLSIAQMPQHRHYTNLSYRSEKMVHSADSLRHFLVHPTHQISSYNDYTNYQGSSSAVDRRNPYVVTNFIIKI